MDKPIAWYDPTNGVVSTDNDCPLFTPLGQIWGLYPKEEWVGLTKEERHEISLASMAWAYTLNVGGISYWLINKLTAVATSTAFKHSSISPSVRPFQGRTYSWMSSSSVMVSLS